MCINLCSIRCQLLLSKLEDSLPELKLEEITINADLILKGNAPMVYRKSQIYVSSSTTCMNIYMHE